VDVPINAVILVLDNDYKKVPLRRDLTPSSMSTLMLCINAVISILNHNVKSRETKGQLVNIDVDAIVNIVVSVLNYYKHTRRDYGSLINADVNGVVNAVVSILKLQDILSDDAFLINVDMDVLINAVVSVLNSVTHWTYLSIISAFLTNHFQMAILMLYG